jgi:hypothetical protein
LQTGHDDTDGATDACADGERREEDAGGKGRAEGHGREEGFGESSDEEETDDRGGF